MATPARANLSIYQGATWSEPITIRDAAGDLVNLTGLKARLAIYDEPKGNVIALMTTENGGLVNGGALGTITPTLQYTDTTDLPVTDEPEPFPYVLKLINEGVSPTTVLRELEGFAFIYPDIEPAP